MLEKSESGTELLIVKKGYKVLSEVLTPDRDQRLRLRLDPQAKKKKAKSKKTDADNRDPYHRFD